MRNLLIAFLALQLLIQLPLFYYFGRQWNFWIRVGTAVIMILGALYIAPGILDKEFLKTAMANNGTRPRCGLPFIANTLMFWILLFFTSAILQLAVVETTRLYFLNKRSKSNA